MIGQEQMEISGANQMDRHAAIVNLRSSNQVILTWKKSSAGWVKAQLWPENHQAMSDKVLTFYPM